MSRFRPTASSVALVALLVFHGVLSAVPVRFLAWDAATAARKLGLQNATGVTEISGLHPDARSAPMNGASGAVPLRLVALDRTSPDGKPVTAEIKAPAGIQSPLVLILPDPKHPTGLRTFVIEDNTSSFRWGTLRFINATGRELLLRLEKTIKPLPNAWTPTDIEPGGAERNMGMQLASPDDLKKILYSAVWENNPDARRLIFLIPGKEISTGSIGFKVIAEDRRILTAEAATRAATGNPNPTQAP
ncbi:MAG: hypothetical protein ACRCXD_08165 [Luteolibacter sp.]